MKRIFILTLCSMLCLSACSKENPTIGSGIVDSRTTPESVTDSTSVTNENDYIEEHVRFIVDNVLEDFDSGYLPNPYVHDAGVSMYNDVPQLTELPSSSADAMYQYSISALNNDMYAGMPYQADISLELTNNFTMWITAAIGSGDNEPSRYDTMGIRFEDMQGDKQANDLPFEGGTLTSIVANRVEIEATFEDITATGFDGPVSGSLWLRIPSQMLHVYFEESSTVDFQLTKVAYLIDGEGNVAMEWPQAGNDDEVRLPIGEQLYPALLEACEAAGILPDFQFQ